MPGTPKTAPQHEYPFDKIHGLQHEHSTPTLEEVRKGIPEELQFEASTDMQYLNQYYFIRQYAYQTDLKVKSFTGEEDEIDRRSHLLIARKGHFCVGGARLTISKTTKRVKLPLERGDYRLTDHLPWLSEMNYCELGRTAIIPQYRDSGALHGLFSLGLDIARANGCQYMVGVSPPSVARHFRRMYLALGLEPEIRTDIPAPLGPENQHMVLHFQIAKL